MFMYIPSTVFIFKAMIKHGSLIMCANSVSLDDKSATTAILLLGNMLKINVCLLVSENDQTGTIV